MSLAPERRLAVHETYGTVLRLPTERLPSYGASEPAYELDPGHPKHPRLRHGSRGLGARCLDFDPGVSCVGGASRGGSDGGPLSALCGA